MAIKFIDTTIVPWEGEVPLGDIVEILVANRLLEPKPIYKVGSWATKATLANLYSDILPRSRKRLPRPPRI